MRDKHRGRRAAGARADSFLASLPSFMQPTVLTKPLATTLLPKEKPTSAQTVKAEVSAEEIKVPTVVAAKHGPGEEANASSSKRNRRKRNRKNKESLLEGSDEPDDPPHLKEFLALLKAEEEITVDEDSQGEILEQVRS